ncbi:MAG TPA: aldo/keto reductase [Acidobacteriota bacterium]|nr:aldo/keto reductase [Acidobacteriota bacterium]
MKKTDLNRRDFVSLAAALGTAAGTSLATPLTSTSTAQGDSLKVPRKKLGSTGVDIPVLGMGGSQKFDANYDKRLHRAFAMGINYFDNSERYSNGQSQKTQATFFEQIGDRKKVWITSKVSHETSPAKGQAPPEHFKNNLEQVLRDFRTDYLDMFFMHGIEDERFLEPEFIKMSEELKRAKKINFFGFSCHAGNLPAILTKAARVGGIDAVMFRYNFRAYGDGELNRAVDAAKEAGIGLIAMKTQGSVPDEDEKLVKFKSENFSLPQAKLKAIWADDRIDSCCSEMENIQMVMENSAAAMSPTSLAMNEFIQLNRLAAHTASSYCQGCQHICQSKIDGEVKVADTLRYLMYHESYCDSHKGREGYQSLSGTEREFDGIDFTQASRACPQGIDIADRLTHAKRLLSS